MTDDSGPRPIAPSQPEGNGQGAAKHGGTFLGNLLGSLISKVIVTLVLALVVAYVVAVKIAHLDLFGSHTTISTTVVLGKLSKIEQVHVATRSYPVNVKITQSVGVIPCFLVCNQMQLNGNGTDDAIVNLATLSKKDVSIDQATKTVTVKMPAPVIGPAELDPASCDISSSHGVLTSATQGFRNNPNGYRPLYEAAETQIHDTALQDTDLLGAGEQSTRQLLARVLGLVGVKKVVVDFSQPADLG
jgi:Protein of unknown function (DUF4230)